MNIRRLYHTLKYLKPIQFYGRVWFRLIKPRVDISQQLNCRGIKSTWVKPVEKVVSQLGPKRFCFLNQEHELTSTEDWNRKEWDKLWLYNLHYFDDLNGADAESRRLWHIDLLEKWVKENPVGQGNGWEPYPTSLRIVNWIKWSLSDNQLSTTALQSLEVQVRYLRKRLEIHLLGNHLLANVKALVFAGLFFQGQEADEWLRKGLNILYHELPEQVLSDGGHFERSPMYHAIVLEDLLDLINIMRAYAQTLPQVWPATTEKMLFWLRAMTHPDGEIALLNDASFGIAPRLDQLFAYAERMGLNYKCNMRPLKGLTCLEQTGYLRWQTRYAVAILDVGNIGPDYLPGHAHADTLSFELSLYGQRLFVDSGISCYGVSAERLRQRSTAAHNTVEVDAQSSSDVWGSFRVARRARPESLAISHCDEGVSVACAHSGYRRLPGKVTHHREWNFELSELVITDSLVGKYRSAKTRFYFHPDVRVRKIKANRFVATLATGEDVKIIVSGAREICVENTTWHPYFGVSLDNKCLVIQMSERKLLTKIDW